MYEKTKNHIQKPNCDVFENESQKSFRIKKTHSVSMCVQYKEENVQIRTPLLTGREMKKINQKINTQYLQGVNLREKE